MSAEREASIAVLIPAYDAQGSVAEAASGARRHLSCVLVVDDGSQDGTGAAAAAAGAEVIRHDANRGKGAALQTGFDRLLQEGVDAVVTMDADLQHDADDIPKLVEAFMARRADLIIGSRKAAFDAMSPGRDFGNRFSCGALKFFTGAELPDTQSGFRLYRSEFLKSLKLRRHAYDAEMEALLVALRDRRRIENIPITLRLADGTGTSHFRPWLDTYRICRTVVQFSIKEM